MLNYFLSIRESVQVEAKNLLKLQVRRKQCATATPNAGMLQEEVFSLEVQPQFNESLVMGFIVTLDRLTTKSGLAALVQKVFKRNK